MCQLGALKLAILVQLIVSLLAGDQLHCLASGTDNNSGRQEVGLTNVNSKSEPIKDQLSNDQLSANKEGAAGQREAEIPDYLLRSSSSGFKPSSFHFELPQVLDSREVKEGPEPKAQTYGVIVDCGSSGTRAHLYHWDTEIDFSLQMLHDIEPVREPHTNKPLTHKVSPGLSSLVDTSREQRHEYIKPLMEFITKAIPASRHKYTGVYFMATAGMRLLDEEDRDSIMNDIRQFVSDSYNFAKVKTSVISGTDEGMYQWISINAKDKRFLSDRTNYHTRTYGVIEMGGASIQVTYQLRPGAGELQARSLPSKLRQLYWDQLVEPAISRSHILDHNYKLHSTTFLGLGSNSARDAYLDVLVHEQYHKNPLAELVRGLVLPGCFGRPAVHDDDDEDAYDAHEGAHEQHAHDQRKKARPRQLVDPCLPRGYSSNQLYRKPTRMLKSASKDKRTVGFIAVDDEETFEFTLAGSGDFNKCKRLMDKMIKLAKEEKMFCTRREERTCTMSLLGENFVPFRKFDFVAISGFYHAFVSPVFGSDESYDHTRVMRRAKRVCNASWQQLSKTYATMKEEHLSSACFRAIWADTFLVKGLKMPEDYDMLDTKNKINDDELDWTLGAILDKSLAIERATETIV